MGAAVPARAQIIAYEGDAFPESEAAAPWTHITQGTPAQRWTDGSLFCQFISPGQLDDYKRTIAEFTGSPSFFVTWREMTDVPRSQLGDSPNGLVAATSINSDVFHFSVTADEVEFVRDNPLGLVLDVDIQPGVLHTYYLALHNDLSYSWCVDGVVVNSGQYPAPYPVSDARVQWWARCFGYSQTAKWDYVRYGVIPADHSGDFNNNGVVDETDLYFFIDCLLGPDYDAAGPGCRWSDMNADGKADGGDVQLFVNAMMGG